MSQHKLNILIVEDELLIAEMLKELLFELDYHLVTIAKNFDLALLTLQNNKDINFAILDINLSETKTGLDIAKKINNEYKIPFIFLTSYANKNTIKEAVALKPEAYLIKPFTKIDLFTTLELCQAKKTESNNCIVIKDGPLSIKLKHNELLWIKSENVYIEIKTVEKAHVIRTSLERFLEELNDSVFIRIHRSYAINLNHVKAINGQYVIINDEKIPLSRNYRDDLILKFQK